MGLRSTGLVVFGSRMLSVVTGLAFTIMVARWLDPSHLGILEIITDLVAFAAYPVGVVAYWTTRDVARGKLVGRTALALGMIISAGGVVLYFVFAFLAYSRLTSVVLPLLLGSLLVPLSYLTQISTSVVQGSRPAAYGYSLMVSEVAKLAVTYPALYIYKAGIGGAIVGLMVSNLTLSVTSFYLVRRSMGPRVELDEGRRWLKLAWIPALSYLPNIVGIGDTFVASLGFGTAIVGYYQAAFLVASIVGYAGSLAYSLYPMLLRGGSEKLTAVTIGFTMLFSIPMATGAAALAGPILFLLGKSYVLSTTGLMILSFTFPALSLSTILDQSLLGMEKVDTREKTRLMDYLKSDLSFVLAVNLFSTVIYLCTMYAALYISFSRGLPDSQIVVVWVLVQLVVAVSTVIVKARRARRNAKLLPNRSVAYYAVSAAVMGAVVYLLSLSWLDRSMETLDYGVRLFSLVAVGAAVYLGLLYAIDSRFRGMVAYFLEWIT